VDARVDDQLAIATLKARYFRLLDTKDWAGWRELFTDDLEFYMDVDSLLPTDAAPITVGGDDFVEYVSKLLTTAVTVHQGHMPEITFTDERTASGVWAMFDWVDNLAENDSIQGFGHYHENYLKGPDNRWRIQRLHLTRIRIDQLAPSMPAGRRPWPQPWVRTASD
jgi:hypothetical protein